MKALRSFETSDMVHYPLHTVISHKTRICIKQQQSFMYIYFDNYTSTLVAQFILTPATKLKNKTHDISLHYNDKYDTIT